MLPYVGCAAAPARAGDAMRLFLVRHGRPLVDAARPAAEWELDPAGFDDIWALRGSGRLPPGAAWFTSPEPKAVQTARLLTESPVAVVDGLREHVRGGTGWIDDFEAVVRRAFEQPEVPAYDGWETLDACRARVTTAVRDLRAARPGADLVLVGHGTAWTVLAAELSGSAPDLARWRSLRMPDLVILEADPRR